tara:strand:+ start:10609 stop:10836 length:228 start_codon:yes stop_codon:yes gene_type:complete
MTSDERVLEKAIKPVTSRFYITVYNPIAGWKAVLMEETDGFCEPWQTDSFAYHTKEEAISAAHAWAAAEGLEVIL